MSYTRSLVGDYSPYYQSGVKLTWTPTSKLTAQMDVVNGWQNISENNTGKGVGVRIDYAATGRSTLSYYNFVSNEAGSRLRVFNGVGGKYATGKLTLQGQLDIGSQSRDPLIGGHSSWYGWMAIARLQATPSVAMIVRAESYNDRDQVIIATGAHDVNGTLITNPAFRAIGGSAGIDVAPYARVLWRTELRRWQNKESLFPNGAAGAPTKSSAFLVTSLALSF